MGNDRILEGKNVLITGANTGIGRVTALDLAKKGAHLFLACRSEERTKPAMQDIIDACGEDRVTFLKLDLGSLDSVRECAKNFNAMNLPLDILINNAGLAAVKNQTKDGFEIAFGVNHLGHFLLTELLRESLTRADSPRVVIVASKAHYKVKSLPSWESLQKRPSTATAFPEYCFSKLANIWHAQELARRYPEYNVSCLHPGVIASDIWRTIPNPIRWVAMKFMITVEEGAQTTIFCATEPELPGENGAYYDECKVRKPSAFGRDGEKAKELWEKSVKWAGL